MRVLRGQKWRGMWRQMSREQGWYRFDAEKYIFGRNASSYSYKTMDICGGYVIGERKAENGIDSTKK